MNYLGTSSVNKEREIEGGWLWRGESKERQCAVLTPGCFGMC